MTHMGSPHDSILRSPGRGRGVCPFPGACGPTDGAELRTKSHGY
jgi:hypothetical protein